MKKVDKKVIKAIIGFVLICLSILWIIYSSYSNKYWYSGWTNMTLVLSTGGIILGGLLMVFGISSAFSIRKRRRMLIKIFLKKFPYICTECGKYFNMKNKYCVNCGEKDSLRETLFQDYEQYSETLKEKFLQKVARKQKELEEKLIKEKEERELLLKNKSKIEDMIYNYLESNINRAFTTKSIMDRVFSDSFTDAPKELVDNSLENLVKHGKIQRTQKENEIFYFF